MVFISFPRDRPALSPSDFLLRRFTRIYPFYWLCCLGVLLIKSVGFLKLMNLSYGDIWSSLILLPSEKKLVGVSWTLSYEIFFYIIFAGFLTLRSRTLTPAFTALALACVVAFASFGRSGRWTDFLANPISLEFCFGLLLGSLFVSHQDWTPLRPIWLLGGLALLSLGSVFAPHSNTHGLPGIWRVICWGMPSALIVAASLSIRPGNTPWKRATLLIGDASYALYLTHIFVMLVYARILKTTALKSIPQLPFVILIIALALLFGIGAHVKIERPLTNALRQFTHRGADRRKRPRVILSAAKPDPES